MQINRRVVALFASLVALILFALGIFYVKYSRNKLTFIVTIPENTPEEDIIYISITDIPPAQLDFQMKKVAPLTYQVSFSKETLAQAYDFPIIRYRYNRNGWGYTTAEHLPLALQGEPKIDPKNESGSNYAYRVARFEEGKVQRDTIERWRWFPKGEIKKEDISKLGPKGDFTPRIGGKEFLTGVGIEDLYVPQFDPFFDHLAKRVKSRGFKFVVLYPPWQWVQRDPLPKIENDVENNPNYPTDEKLIEHIRAFKNAGLKVYMEPQICCNPAIDIEPSEKWQQDYMISEVQRFLVHFARVAQRAGVDAFLFDTFGIDSEQPGFAKKMEKMFREVKKEFEGEIYAKVVPFLSESIEVATEFLPDIEKMSWGDEVDFFVFDAEGQLSPKDNPTDSELAKGAGVILDLAKKVYDEFGKPVMVRSSYFSIRRVWKGSSFHQRGRIPGHEDSEFSWKFHTFSGYDQARVDNAYFEAIRTRPWIIAFLHFGYTHWDMPLLPDWNIRARAAEDLWVKWNQFFE